MRALLALILVFSVNSWAEDETTEKSAPTPAPAVTPAAPVATPESNSADESTVSDAYKTHHYTFKAGASDYNYEEPGLMKIHGRLYQLETGYRGKFGHSSIPFIYGGNISYAFGKTTYDGGLVNTLTGVVTPVSEDSNEKIFDLEGYFGASFFDSHMQAWDAFGGLGIWALTNKIEGSGSYQRDITYLYMPLGTRYTFRPSSGFKMMVGVQYDLFVYGSVKTHLSDLSSKYDDVTNTQTSGSGAKATAGVEFTQTHWSLLVEAFYQAWDIGDSSVEPSGGKYWREPHNTTKMLGLNIGGRF
ncbi:MAG: hypothetical protein ACXVA9_06780 [Bdellovibrionales bacterium]